MAIPVREEQDWARHHPEPGVEVQDVVIMLWNYPVAKTDLAPKHRAALKDFLKSDFLELGLTRSTKTQLHVTGHASDTGEASANDTLSRDRARKVARFLVSEGFPSAQIRVQAQGSAQPLSSGSFSGLTASRNRRVEVLREVPPEPEKPRPPIEPKPSRPSFVSPKSGQPSSLKIEWPLDIKLPPINTSLVVIEGTIGGVLEIKVDDKGGGWGSGPAISEGKLAVKFEEKIKSEIVDLKSKISFEKKYGDEKAVLKVGGETRIGQLDTTVGMQTKLPDFVYCEFKFELIQLPEIELGDVHVTMTLKPTLKISAGPGKALLARVGVSAGAAGGIVAGTILFSALLMVATVATVEYAKEEGIRTARLLAKRDGVAARVAMEVAVAANEGAGDIEFRNRLAEWAKAPDDMVSAFNAGAKLVQDLLDKGPRDKIIAEWSAKHGSSSQQFGDVHKAVLAAIKPYEDGDVNEDPTTRL